MGSALVVALVKYGLLALLWVFVLLAVRAVRDDLWGSGRGGAVAAAPARAAGPARKGRRGDARTLVVTEGALQGTTLSLTDAPCRDGISNLAGVPSKSGWSHW